MGLESFELEPTRENIIRSIEQDIFGRNEDVWRFASFCSMMEGRSSIAIDGRWGEGKTFFIKETQILFESKNSLTNAVSKEERDKVNLAFSKYNDPENIDQQVCVYYDAWANDNQNDPILSIVYQILQDTDADNLLAKNGKLFDIAASMADLLTGRDVAEFWSNIQKKDPIDSVRKTNTLKEDVTELLNTVIQERGNRLVIFIDELDRCRPDYAVCLLERIKHYFSIETVTFVFAVNLVELQHTIRRFYGNNFDADRYLDRFFDYRISLPPANMEKYYMEIGLRDQYGYYEKVCKAVMRYCNFSIRETERFYRSAKIAIKKYFDVRGRDYDDERVKATRFSSLVFVPLLIGLRMQSMSLYTAFTNGDDGTPLVDLFSRAPEVLSACADLLNDAETYKQINSETKKLVQPKDKLLQAYGAVFGKNNSSVGMGVLVGNSLFYPGIKQEVLRAANLLSDQLGI